MSKQQELLDATKDLKTRIERIRDRVAEIDAQIKNTSVNDVERIETELADLKNTYYEIQARELLGEFEAKQKKEIEEKMLLAERRLRGDSDKLQNLVGVRHALGLELKKAEALEAQYQAASERLEFENLKMKRQELAGEINAFLKQLEALFSKVTDYNLESVTLASKILHREYHLKGFTVHTNLNENGNDKVQQLAQPFDLNQIKNSLAEALSEIISRSLASRILG
jgi:hypothetical protein